MFRPARFACCALAVLALVVAVAVRTAALADVGFDLSDLPVWLHTIDHELDRREKLLHQLREIHAASLLRTQVSRDLIDGKLSLGEATRRFCELADRPESAYRELLGYLHPAASEEETLCRHVIFWTCKLLEEEPSRQKAVCRRLEIEMREHLQAMQ
jgi:hypothetical protein